MGTISEKLVYLNGTKQAIKQAINEDFEVIDDNTTFREYADEISSNNAKYKDLIPKETKNATNTLDISNSSGLDKALVTQYGNTYQDSTSGKNIFDVNSVTSVTNGSISDEIITTNETSDSTYSAFPYFHNISLPANTYYLSMDIRIKSGTGYFNKINDAATDWAAVSKPSLSTTFQRYVYSHTYTSVTTLNHILIQFISSTNAVYEIANIMLSTSSDTNYEKYTGGNPAPNPDYPQEIVNISGKSTLKDVGKNLFDKSNITTGKTFTNTGAISSLTNSFIQEIYIPVSSETDYTMSTANDYSSETDYRLVVCEYDSNKNFIKRNLGGSAVGNKYTITTSSTTKYVRLCASTITLNELQFKKGPTASDYEPYQEQSFDLDLKSRNLFDKDNVIVGKVYNSNGELVNSGQWNTNNDFEKVNENKVSISCKTTGTVNSLLIEFDENKNFIQRQQVNYNSSSLTLNTNTKYIRYCYQNTLGMYDIQIEESSTASDYESFYDINLSKIDTYKDRIYSLNGKWYLEKFSEKVTIDGTNIAVTNRRETNTSGNYSFTFLFSKKAKRVDGTTTQGGYCDKLVSKPRNNIYGRTQGFGYGATNNDYWGDIVIFRTDWATKTITDVNTDLKSNPIELEYLLDSAETIEITESNYPTLYNQLNDIKLFEGVNHITMTNESGLDVEFDIEYYKDWKLD